MPSVVGRLRTPQLTAAPSSPVKGEVYFDTTTNKLYWYNGTAWVAAEGGAGGTTIPNPGRIGVATSPSPPTGTGVLTDFNTATESGWYNCNVGTNGPPAATHWHVEVIAYNTDYLVQIAYALYDDRVFTRRRAGGTWSAWKALTPMTGTFVTGSLSNSTQYGWNVFFATAQPTAPIAVVAVTTAWNIMPIIPISCQNYNPGYFDLWLFNVNQSANFTIRWVAYWAAF